VTTVDYETLDDATLLGMVQQKDKAALEVIYDRYSRLVFSIAYHLVSDDAIAEEITMDIFVRVWEKASQYQSDRAKVTTWLTSLTRNRSIDWLRKNATRTKAQDNPELVSLFEQSNTYVQPAENQAELSLRREAVQQALSKLPPEQLQVVELSYFKGYVQTEIADMLDIPVGTVKSRMRLAMIKLRDLLDGQI